VFICGYSFSATDTEQLRQAELRQQQIRQQTQAAADQIAQIIAEFERNGLGDGDDVKLLRQLHSMLGSLSSEQMAQVISLLQQARANPSDPLSAARDAHDRQTRILTDFRRVLAEYQKQQTVYAMAARIRQLMERQQMAMRSAVDLSKAMGDGNRDNPDAKVRASLAVQSQDQQSLAGEADEILAALSSMAQTPGMESADRLDAGVRLARDAGLLDTMRQAVGDLQQNNLFRAATLQRNARDTLRKLWRQVSPSRDRAQQLSDAALELQQHIEMQAAVSLQGKDVKDKTAGAAVERRQGDLVDRTDMTRGDLDTLVPAAADFTKQAIRQMNAARRKLDHADNPEQRTFASEQSESARLLTAARDEVLKELRNEQDRQAQQQAQNQEKDRLERTREAIQKVQELKKQQEQLAKDNKPENAEKNRQQQQQLEQQARDLASQTSKDTPQASQQLDQSASQMRQAAEQMRQQPDDPSAAQPNQQQAQDALTKAEQELQKQEQQLSQAHQELQKVEQAQQQVEKLQQEQARASQQTQNAARQPDKAKQQQQAQQAQQQQEQTKQDTQQAQQQVQDASPEAGDAVKQAQDQMQQANQDLKDNKPAEARPDQNRAEQQLADAQKKLEQRADELRQQLDQPSNDAQQADDAMKDLQQASDQAKAAEQQLAQQNQDSDQAAQHLEQGAEKSNEAAAQDGQAISPDAQAAAQEATSQLREAAAQAQAGNKQAAQEATQKAQQALAQAQQSIRQAQAAAAEEAANEAQQQANAGKQAAQQNSQQPQKPDLSAKATDPKQWDGSRAAKEGGPRDPSADGNSSYINLPPRERQALQQSRGEKYPEEYGPMIEQYLRNLSQGGTK
jgi:hypothetical protein